GNTVMKTLNWMPHFGMNFDLYLDGLGLLFSLLISGIGSLVVLYSCLLYTSDAADDTPCVDLGGRRIIKKVPVS
ncbi:hypothetical protein, partial [Staphylococcus aureus]